MHRTWTVSITCDAWLTGQSMDRTDLLVTGQDPRLPHQKEDLLPLTVLMDIMDRMDTTDRGTGRSGS